MYIYSYGCVLCTRCDGTGDGELVVPTNSTANTSEYLFGSSSSCVWYSRLEPWSYHAVHIRWKNEWWLWNWIGCGGVGGEKNWRRGGGGKGFGVERDADDTMGDWGSVWIGAALPMLCMLYISFAYIVVIYMEMETVVPSERIDRHCSAGTYFSFLRPAPDEAKLEGSKQKCRFLLEQ